MTGPEVWKSPRRIEAEEKAYVAQRFERYMTLEDRQELSRELAIAALRDELMSANEIKEIDGIEATV